MATYDLPPALKMSVAGFQIQKSGLQFKSPFNGTIQSVGFIAERWLMSITSIPYKHGAAGLAEAFLNRLSGGVNKVRMHHPTRLVPVGSLRGTPAVLNAHARGDTELVMTVASGATLCAGDLLGVAGHLFQIAEDCAAVGTTLTAPLVNRVRGPIANGAAVTWDRPTTLFVMPAQMHGSVYRPGYMEGSAFDLEEAWD